MPVAGASAAATATASATASADLSGSATLRLVVDSLPPGTTTIGVSLTVSTPTAEEQRAFDLCGGANPTPCAAPAAYEQAVTGVAPGAVLQVSVTARLTSGDLWLLWSGYHVADGSTITADLTGSLTVRLVLNALPAGTTSIGVSLNAPFGQTAVPQSTDRGAFILCGGANRAPCTAPAIYEQTFTGVQRGTVLGWAVRAFLPNDNERLVSRGQHRADGSAVVATFPTPPAPPTVGEVVCTGDLLDNQAVGGHIRGDGTNYVAAQDLCILGGTWLPRTGAPAAGTASLTVDGEVVYIIDLAQWDEIGIEGAGSGERVVWLDTPIGVSAGQTLRLQFEACNDPCEGTIEFWFQGVASYRVLPATNT